MLHRGLTSYLADNVSKFQQNADFADPVQMGRTKHRCGVISKLHEAPGNVIASD